MICEVLLSNLEYSGRLDAEYYRPEFLRNEDLLRTRNSQPLSNLASFLIGPFGSAFNVENYSEERTYRYVRGKDIKQMCLMEDDNVYMPKADFERLSKYALRPSDILVSVVGTLGNAAIVEEEHTPAIFSCKSTVLRPIGINPHYLLVYLNSSFGHSLLLRKERGAIQKGLNLDDLKTLDIYVAGEKLQKASERLYKKAREIQKLSKSKYSQAQSLLLSELGLTDWQPSQEKVSIKSFKESFGASGRLDAEYYQVKYDDFFALLIQAAKNKNYQSKRLGDISAPLKYGSSTKLDYTETGIPFLRIADLMENLFEHKNLKYISEGAASLEKTATVKTNDVLISRSGTLGLSVVIPQFLDCAIFGSYFIRIRPKKDEINSQYLALYLNSIVGKIQVEQVNTGGIQTNLTIPVIENLKIVCPPIETQNKIVEIIQSSYLLRAKAGHYLEVAKHAVEIAIEHDEDAALAYISEETKGVTDLKSE